MFVTAAHSSMLIATQSMTYVLDLETRQYTLESLSWRVAPADGSSTNADISADGRFVVFESVATNLTNEELPPDTAQVFLRDREVGADTPADDNRRR